MLLNGGELEGVRILQPQTVTAMRTNQLPATVRYGSSLEALGVIAPTAERGQAFGLGLCIRTSEPADCLPGNIGDFHWPGISGTNFWCDPVHNMVVVVMLQAPSMRHKYRELARRCVYADLLA